MKVQIVPIDQVKPYELNAKMHDDEQVQKIANSIRQFGFDQPIVVDKDFVVIKGHGRRLACIKLGITEVPVVVRDDLSDDEVRASRLSDNRVAISDIDGEIFKQELASLNFSLDGIFDEKELNFFSVDMGEINLDAVISDISAEVEKQDKQTFSKIEEIDNSTVKIEKALGFKEIKGKDEKIIVRFVAIAENETGKDGAEAFVEYIEKIIKER